MDVEFNGGGQAMKLGPYEADFEYTAEKGRKAGERHWLEFVQRCV